MATKSKEGLWTTLKDRVDKALEKEKLSLGAVFLELERISRTLDELAEMKKDYHPERLAYLEDSASIGQIQRNWNFVSNLEAAIRNTNQQKIAVKKKERMIREHCTKLESELKKFQTLEGRAIEKRRKADELKDRKAADEVAAAYWLRQQLD